MTSETPTTNPTIDLMTNRASVRRFTDDAVDDALVDTIVEAARRSPTSSNWQTYSIIVVRDPETKSQLAELSGGQGHVEQSQVFLVFVADIHRLKQASALHGTKPAGGFNQTVVSIVDAAIVGQSAQIAAEALGLGAVMVGGTRLYPREVAELLGLPDGVFVVFGMSVGWPSGDPSPAGLKPRLPVDLVVHQERYSDDNAEELIRIHDAELKEFYERRGRNLDEAAWSGPVARGSQIQRYTTLRDFIVERGFSLD